MKVTRADWPGPPSVSELQPITAGRELEYSRRLPAHATDRLLAGSVPREMDDQWFIFEEDDVVHAHRSWTGIEMFAIRLRRLPDGSCEIVGVTVDDLCGYRIPLRRRFARFRPRRFHDADESALHILDTFFDSVSGVPTMATGLDVAVFGWNPTEFGYIPGEW